jgi:hypothetical protein
MPVGREGKFIVAEPAELRNWLGAESHMKGPAHVLTENADMCAALKESISVARRNRKR